MKIPHPENPEHIENLLSISLLEAQGFEGTDRDLATSLFEYNLIWRDIGDEFLFVYRHPTIADKFDRTTIKKDLNVFKEYDWVSWNGFFDYLGTAKDEWEKVSLPRKISDLLDYYSVEEIFGSSYWDGFSVEEN